MRDLTVRPDRREDHDAIAVVQRMAFDEEGPRHHPVRGDRVAALVDDLRLLVTPDQGCSLVAEAAEGGVVGHIMLTPAVLDAPPRLVTVLVLGPLGVIPSAQGRGVGTALIREALRRADEQQCPVVFLEGDPAYYARAGFVEAGALGFRKPSLRIPDRAFQCVLLAAHEPWMTGTLVYPEAFWRHDAVGLRDP